MSINLRAKADALAAVWKGGRSIGWNELRDWVQQAAPSIYEPVALNILTDLVCCRILGIPEDEYFAQEDR